MLLILSAVLIPWHMFLVGRILLVGLVIYPVILLLSAGIFFCRDKWVSLYTLSLCGKGIINLAGLKNWYEFPQV